MECVDNNSASAFENVLLWWIEWCGGGVWFGRLFRWILPTFTFLLLSFSFYFDTKSIVSAAFDALSTTRTLGKCICVVKRMSRSGSMSESTSTFYVFVQMDKRSERKRAAQNRIEMCNQVVGHTNFFIWSYLSYIQINRAIESLFDIT